MAPLTSLKGLYDVVYADPPWPYYGDPNKMGAAGKEYSLMTTDEINGLPVRALFKDAGACFVWATCPKLDLAIDAIRAWGLYYRGVAFTWQKTARATGEPVGAQGVPPTATKPTMELVLLGTTCKTGRPFKLLDSAVRQDIYESRQGHSVKPEEVRRRIDRLYGKRPSIELFARRQPADCPNWAFWGNEL
jgi:N6-adenosine-specific RNA methylase IME4